MWLRSCRDNPGISEVGDVANPLMHLICVERSRIGPQNVCVGGYSQGGTIAIHDAVTMGMDSMHWVIALNAWVLPYTVASMVATSRQPTLMIFNGAADVRVNLFRAQASLAGFILARIDHPTRDIKHAIQPSVERKVISCAMAKLFPYP